MSSKRTPIGREPRPRISEQAIAMYRRLKELNPESREFSDLSVELDWAFNRRPWMESIMYAPLDMDPDDCAANDDHDIAGAIEIRRALEALAFG